MGDVIVSTTLESKPTVGAGSLAGLYAKPVVGMKVPVSDLRRRYVFTPVCGYPADTAPSYFNEKAAPVDIELESQ